MPYTTEKTMRGAMLVLDNPQRIRTAREAMVTEKLPSRWGEKRSDNNPIPNRETIEAASEKQSH